MANVLVISETPQRVIIRDEAATRTVKVVAQGPQGPAGSVNPMMFTLRDQAQASADSAAIDASTAQSSSASAFASANAAGASAASVSASELAAEGSAVQAAASASQAGASAASVAASATSAQASATSAANSATSAQASADAVIDKANIADAAAASATDSAAMAATKATEAATSATNAASSATSASTSATTATTKAAQASTSATLAQDWAIKTVDPVSGAEYSSKYHAQAASASAGSASSSANSAAASATTAGTKAGEASASAASALDSEDVASVAAQFAVNAQSSAQTSANAALASKNAAATSATSASDSATAASNSATAAAGSATSAGNSATGASSSAVAAAGSAATATTKASEASTSATNAAASATAAATSATNTANALVGERSAVATLTNKTITNPVIDSGAANGVAYLNGSKVLTAGDGLTFDGANVNAPTYHATQGAPGFIIDNQVTGAARSQYVNSGGNLYLGLDNSAGGLGGPYTANYWHTGNYAHVWGTGNVERMRLDASGNLGIGTSSPYWKLSVSDGVTQGGIAPSAGTLYFGTRSSSPIVFRTNDEDKMVLDIPGNLGLGVVPSVWLSHFKAIDVGSGAAYAGTDTTARVFGNSYCDTGFTYRYKVAGSASYYYCGDGIHQWSAAPSGAAGSPISFTQAMTLDASGKLLVGRTAAPIGSIALVEAEGRYGSVRAGWSAWNFGVVNGNTDAFTIDSVSSGIPVERMRIDSGGHLIIGPTGELDRINSVFLHPIGGQGQTPVRIAGFGVSGTANTSYNGQFRWLTSNGYNSVFKEGYRLLLRSSDEVSGESADLFSISGSGSLTVGNGGYNNLARLVVKRDAASMGVFDSASIVLSNRSQDINGGIMGGIFADTYRDVADPHYVAGIWFTRKATSGNLSSASEIVFGAQSNNAPGEMPFERMRLNEAGQLMIGVGTPQGVITTYGGSITATNAGSADTGIAVVNDGATYIGIGLNTSGATNAFGVPNGSGYFGSSSAYPLVFCSGGVEHARINSNGDLRIGVGAGALNGSPRVMIGKAGGINSPIFGWSDLANNSGYGYIIPGGAAIGADGHLAFGSGAIGLGGFTEYARLDTSGNLLVGTTFASDVPLQGVQLINLSSVGRVAIGHASGSVSGELYANFAYSGTAIGSITQNGTTAVAYNTSSDYRLKNITGPITTSGAYIDSLNPVEGSWKADGSTFVGLIAHEVQEASRTQVATGVKDGEEMQAMDYSASELIANMIAELKSLRARVAALENN